MAINVVIPLLIPLEEDLHNATRSTSGSGRSMIEFSHNRYCAVVREDAPVSSEVIRVNANHKQGVAVKYTISGGNEDGLFSIDEYSGVVTLAAALDHELFSAHEIIVSGRGRGQVGRAVVRVAVADVNDNAPYFMNPDPVVTVIEEDDRHLPTTLLQIEAEDPDESDKSNLRYFLEGDGVDGFVPAEAYFTIDSRSGALIQHRALDRDPPNGKRIWKLRVQVKDGQTGRRRQVRRDLPENHIQLSGKEDIFSTTEDHNPKGDATGRLNSKEQTISSYVTWPADPSGYGSEYSFGETTHVIEPHVPWNKRHQAKRRARNLNDLLKTHENPLREKDFDYSASDAILLSESRVTDRGSSHYISGGNSVNEYHNYRTSFNAHYFDSDEFRKLSNTLTNKQFNRYRRHKRLRRESKSDNGTKGEPYSRTQNVNPLSNDNILCASRQHKENITHSKEMGGNGPYLKAKNDIRQLLFHQNVFDYIPDPDSQNSSDRSLKVTEKKGIRPSRCKSPKANGKGQKYRHEIRDSHVNHGSKGTFKDKNSYVLETPKEGIQARTANSQDISLLSASSHSQLSLRKGLHERNVNEFKEKISQYIDYQPKIKTDDKTEFKNISDQLEQSVISSPLSEVELTNEKFLLGTTQKRKYFRNKKFGSANLRQKYFQDLRTLKGKQMASSFFREIGITHLATVSRRNKHSKLRGSEKNSRSFPKEPDVTESQELGNIKKAYEETKSISPPQSFLSSPTSSSSLDLENTQIPKTDFFLFTKDKERGDIENDNSKIAVYSKVSLKPSNSAISDVFSSVKNTNELFMESNRNRKSEINSKIASDVNNSSKRKHSRPTRSSDKRQLNPVTAIEDKQCTEQLAASRFTKNQMTPQGEEAVHTVEMDVTIIVKDINDNAPVFPNITMFAEIQENGPAELWVAEVWAWDADDATEGTNARITYFIEKNVIHDKSGDAIFNVEPQTGLITTALCCLDREVTPQYYIQVVASDGGGLRGTGTVVVQLSDENDNSPRLARKSWELEIYETRGDGPPDNTTLLEMTAADPDSKNDFSFRVVTDSGPGWDLFDIRSSGRSGQLYAIHPLNYEDDSHRQGFKFMVQVTDRGEEGWEDPRHQDTAWVGVRLKDLNDNPPYFKNPNSRITVPEDSIPGTLLLNMTADDPDTGRGGRVKYQISGELDALRVDRDGSIYLQRPLDRELDEDSETIYTILASDEGRPSLTSTATLTITILDANDCPPRLLPPTVFQVQEGEPPVKLGVLTATDDDVWALGHGPPFTLSLAETNPSFVFDLIDLKFDQYLDSGRGGAEIWTLDTLDREAHHELQVDVLLVDASSLNTTQTITIIVGDLNDNPMKPASKTVYLWKTQNIGSAAPLGRVYVDDPDDWDVVDKTFNWAGKPHPLFSLNTDDGTIYASSQVREGRHDLQFLVNDQKWDQVGVSANVSVIVRFLSKKTLAHATPIHLTPTTPTELTRGWTPTAGGGKLGKVIEKIEEIISDENFEVDIVSVYGTDSNPSLEFIPVTSSGAEKDSSYTKEHRHPRNPTERYLENVPLPYACVWICAVDARGKFMDLVKLQGLLTLNVEKLENATGLTVTFKEPERDFEKPKINLKGSPSFESYQGVGEGFQMAVSPEGLDMASDKGNLDTISSMASTVLPLQVVDTNMTSFVTPLLSRLYKCNREIPLINERHYASESCTPSSCLNGGKCVRFPSGSRCICPGGSKGRHCKIISRTFKGRGWIWLQPLPSCLPISISFRLLTTRSDALLLYQGPLSPHSRNEFTVLPMLTVQIRNKTPELLVEGLDHSATLKVNTSVSDGDWHSIHIRLDEKGAAIMVDLCGLGWEAGSTDDSHCVARTTWKSSVNKVLEIIGPLQMGGIAQSHLIPEDFGWKAMITPHPLEGCISNFMVNDQIADLSEPSYSQGTDSGCQLQEAACSRDTDICSIRGECVGGLTMPWCRCDLGWSGTTCNFPTVPTTLGFRSFMKMALSFTPPSQVIVVEIRFRTLGPQTGTLLHLNGQHTNNSFTVHLQSGVACATMSGAGWGVRIACVRRYPVGDGKWHTIKAEKHGHNLLTIVDDGENGRFNYSLPSLLTDVKEEFWTLTGPPMPLEIDKHEGVTIGGLPQFTGSLLLGVQDDLQETCISDIRVSGHQLPLPPMVNGSSWGQVTTTNGLTKECQAPRSPCLNVTCKSPLACHSSWMNPTCSCGPGRQLVGHICVDVDECLLQPCLHGGTCYNLEPGYQCLCGPGRLGDHCEWSKVPGAAHPFSVPVVAAAITFSFLILVLLGIFLSLRQHRLRTARRKKILQKTSADALDSDTFLDPEIDEVVEEVTDRKKSLSSREKCQRGRYQTVKCQEDQSHRTFLELLKLSKTPSQKNDSKDGGDDKTSETYIAVVTSPKAVKDKGVKPLLQYPANIQHYPHHQPHLPGEDLRNYAYEGDGSSYGSLSSTLSGIQTELDRDEELEPISKEFGEVMDLLKNLPDAPKSSTLLRRFKIKETSSSECAQESRAGSIKSKVSPAHSSGVNNTDTCEVLPSSAQSTMKAKDHLNLNESDGKSTVC